MSALGTCRILVVDDEQSILKLVERTMTEAGFYVETALNGMDALEKMTRDDYEIVISDIVMPQMDGRELIQKILENYASDVIVMTGRIDMYTYEQFIPEGASDFVKKPFSQDEIFLRVERVLRERRLRESLALAQSRVAHCQKMESIGQIAAGLIHEIKTPVQYIADNIDFISEAVSVFTKDAGQDTGGDPAGDTAFMREELPGAIAQTKEGINQVHKIIKSVKSFSHPGAADHIEYDIKGCIKDAVNMSKNEWKYVARIKKHFDEKTPLIICNPVEITQVVLNLIVNSCHAITEKQQGDNFETGEIAIATIRDKGGLTISVSDNGSGIAHSHMDRIFNPFFTTKPIDLGTGQGLSISKSIIEERHKGRIQVMSHQGKGTRFTITLPQASGECRQSEQGQGQ